MTGCQPVSSTTVSPPLALLIAQVTAFEELAEPSTPTTMRRCDEVLPMRLTVRPQRAEVK
jgi:hypothetical protein